MKSIDGAKTLIQTEINELEASISTRKSEINTAYNDAIKLAERSKKEAEKEISSVLKNIETLKNVLSNMSGKPEKSLEAKKVVTHKILEVPSKWSDKLTVKDKVAFVLTKLGHATKEDIAHEIASLEKGDVAQTLKAISGQISSLKGKGLLSARKDGRKDVLSLVK